MIVHSWRERKTLPGSAACWEGEPTVVGLANNAVGTGEEYGWKTAYKTRAVRKRTALVVCLLVDAFGFEEFAVVLVGTFDVME